MNSDPILTADDLIRAGACADGVYDVIERIGNRQRISAAMPLSAILLFLLDEEERDYATDAAQVDGCGDYGYGSSDGQYGGGTGCGDYGLAAGTFGSGYGSGCCYGSGYGYGFRSGDGSSSGDGLGDSSGYGSGYDNGSGYGYDNHYGSGSGDGSYGYASNE